MSDRDEFSGVILPVQPYERGFQMIRRVNVYRRAYGKWKFIKSMHADQRIISREVYELNLRGDGEYFDLECIAQHVAINTFPSNQPYMD
jgi:hypothetical protein